MPEHPLAGLMIATQIEAEPFIETFHLRKIEEKPFPVFGRGEVLLTVSGIGKANAAMATAFSCIRFGPEWICNLGAAGATRESFPLGSIFHIDKVTEPDRPHLRSTVPHIHVPDVLGGFPTATLATRDRAVISPKARREASSSADLVDMEGASVIQAADRFEIPCILFKFVSDTPLYGEHGQVSEQIKIHGPAFSRFFADSVVPVMRKARG